MFGKEYGAHVVGILFYFLNTRNRRLLVRELVRLQLLILLLRAPPESSVKFELLSSTYFATKEEVFEPCCFVVENIL